MARRYFSFIFGAFMVTVLSLTLLREMGL